MNRKNLAAFTARATKVGTTNCLGKKTRKRARKRATKTEAAINMWVTKRSVQHKTTTFTFQRLPLRKITMEKKRQRKKATISRKARVTPRKRAGNVITPGAKSIRRKEQSQKVAKPKRKANISTYHINECNFVKIRYERALGLACGQGDHADTKHLYISGAAPSLIYFFMNFYPKQMFFILVLIVT